jgi:uncharacterized protein (DUF488 family)
MKLATIGYEGAALSDFISTLLTADIERVIDVREVAQSRRPGFSKSALRTALAEVDIDYFHIRQLGDPKPGREAARAGNFDLFHSIFSAHVALPASQDALREAVALASDKHSVLLCFERDPKHCHRTIVADRMVALCSLKVKHLGVQPRNIKGAQHYARAADRVAGAH